MDVPDGFTLTVGPSGHHRLTLARPDPPPRRPRLKGPQFYLPYTTIHPQVVQAAPTGTIWVDVAAHPDAYWAALHSWWARGQDFAVLEHDIICRPDVVQAFQDCPEPWCAFGYANMCHPQCMEAWRNALGCTRFRAEAMRLVPDAVSAIPAEGRDWHNLCDWLGNRLRAEGLTHHWHTPPVDHHPWTDVHPPQRSAL